MRLRSFDIFDTLLTRAVGQPGDSFLLLGARLARRGLISCSAEMFARARGAAEHQAFANWGGLDSPVDLEQIYVELAAGLGLSDAQRAVLIAEELALEAELLRPVPSMVQELADARAAGARIVYVSDMYLPAQTIRQLLHDQGIAAPDDPLYVSNHHRHSKESGRLFQTMLSGEQGVASQTTHTGNNAYADVACARRVGLNARHFAEGNLNRYEEALSRHAFATGGLASTLAGASRLARLNVPAQSDRERALRDVSAGAAAPLLVAFTLWALREATRLGLRRLYFASRDGQVILEIARRLAPRLGLDLELRYLYGSRQAWTLPGVTAADEGQLGRIFGSFDIMAIDQLTVEGALERVDIRPAELAHSLRGAGFDEASWARNLNKEERAALRDYLLHDPAAGELILSRAAAARALTLAYLEQEGWFDGVPFALVDLGTGGTLHRALELVLADVACQPLISLYLGKTGSTDDLRGQLLPYYFDAQHKTGFREVPGLVTLIETVCSADHGTVLGYERTDGQVRPLLKEQGNAAVYAWGYGLVRATICRFAELLLVDPELVNPWADLRPAAAEALELFWMRPTLAEADAWSSFPFEDGWGKASYPLRLGRPFRWGDLPRIVRTRQLRHHRHNWQRGSLALTPPVLRGVLSLVVLAQSLSKQQERSTQLRRLRRLPRRLLRQLQGAG